MVAVRHRVTDPVGVYHALLENDGLAAASIGVLHDGQRENRLVFGDRPVSITLRPQLVSARRYQDAVSASQTIYAALGRLENALLADPELRAELDLEPEEERLALADPGCQSS
jgi:hypothetical protein